MFERQDGILIYVFEEPSTRTVKVNALIIQTLERFDLNLTLVEFDDLFRYDSDLMNPNKKLERYAWVAERICPRQTENGNIIVICDHPVTSLVENTCDDDSLIPIGRLGFAERRRLREAVRGKELKRNESIRKKELSGHVRFLELLSRFRDEKAALESERRMRISVEEAEREREKNIEEEKRHLLRVMRDELEQLRASKIADRSREQTLRMYSKINKIIEEGKRGKKEKENTVVEWRAKKHAASLNVKVEMQQFLDYTKCLEKKREEAHQARECRFLLKARNYLDKRDEVLKKLSRAAIILSEKKKAQLFALFGPLH